MRIWYNDFIDKNRHDLFLSTRALSSTDINEETKSEIYVTLDGYIENKEQLCSELQIDKNEAIVSVIISLYETYGEQGFYKLVGGFSLILIDKAQQHSFLYRSFLTGFPLYYVAKNNLLSVAANPVNLLHREDVSDTLNKEQISALFDLRTEAWADTVFSDLNEVEHGELVMVSPEGIRSIKRPLTDILPKLSYGSEAEIIKKYRQLVDSAIAKHILPNKKYGIMLSSGMDSSTLAVLASRQLEKRGEKLIAYSWSLPNYPMADETKKIKALCMALDIELTIVNVEHLDPFSNLDHLPLTPEFPFPNLYSAMISKIYEQASEDGVDILFNGHYGDELFPSTATLFSDILKDKRYELLIPTLKSIIEKVGYKNVFKSPAIRGLIKHLIPFYKVRKPVFRVSAWLSDDAKEVRRVAWEKEIEKREEGYEVFASALSKSNTSSGITRYITEQYGIERIEPYRDVALLNYTLKLPAYMAYRDGQLKYFAREAMRGLLPESIRTQARVGILSQFAEDSFLRNTQAVEERLFSEVESWNVYVDEKWMIEKFKNPSQIKGKDILLVWMCLHIGAWTKAIKPGGSLYENTYKKTLFKKYNYDRI